MYRFNQLAVRTTLKSSIGALAGPAIVVLVLLANLAYVAFGDTLKASSARQPETSLSAVQPAHGGGAPDNVSGSSAEPTDYFPAGYVDQGGDGDGNVKTYGHD